MPVCRGRAGVLAAALAAVVAAGAAPVAEAARLDDGRSKIRFDARTFGALADAGIVVATGAPARAGRLRAAFPITGGDADPVSGRGFYSHRGTLAFTDGGKRIVELQQLRVSVGHVSTVTARLGDTRITIAHLRGTPRVAHDSDRVRLRGLRLRLTSTAASALNEALRTDVFAPGARLGRLDTRAHLSQLVLTAGYTALTADPATVRALEADGVTLSPLRGTRVGRRGDVILPLVSGLVERTTLVGRIRHAGGLVFRKGDREVAIANFDIDVTRAPSLTALTAAGRLTMADVVLPDAPPDVDGDRMTVDGVGLTLTADAARALNRALGTTVFAPGVSLGTAVIRGVVV